MMKPSVTSAGFSNRTPWVEAIREVPAAWLADEARRSPSPYSLLASWKGSRGGVPSHVMLQLLRRRLRESQPELINVALPPARLQRAQDMLTEIWTRTGEGSDRVWRVVEGALRFVQGTARIEPDPLAQTSANRQRPKGRARRAGEGTSTESD
jgi:hypothetical protein